MNHEPEHDAVDGVLRDAAEIFTSSLSLLEGHRYVARLRHLESRANAFRLERALAVIEVAWWIVPVTDELLVAGRPSLPVETVRTLDSIHLATVRDLRAHHDLAVLALDRRVRSNAAAEGVLVLPPGAP